MSDTRSFMALDWVRDEIEGTLKQAQEALEAYVEAGSDATQARQCLTRLHQVHGTLQMVELEGAVAFAGELEAVAQALMDGSLADETAAQEALMEGILQLAAHLDRVQRGAADELGPYRALLNRLRVARGAAPEESISDSVDAAAVTAFIEADGPAMVRQLRARFQKAMLALLRKSQPVEKLMPFLDRLFTQLEATTPVSPLSRLWALAAAGMERHDTNDQAGLLRLLRGLDAEIRGLADAPEQALGAPLPTALSDALRQRLEPASDSDSARVIALRSQWSAAVADGAEDFASGADDATIATVAGALHEELAGIRDQLDLFARGSVKDSAELSSLAEVLQRVAGTLAVVGLDDLKERISSQLEAVSRLVRDGSASDDAVMDVASAVLEVDGRLMALAGIDSEDGELIPGSLSDAHAAVLREVRSSLEGVKQSIVDFISSEWEHEHLSPIAGTLAAVRSVLGLIPLERAGNLVECCRLYLQNEILADQSVPEWQRLDTLADALTSIDYYLERMLADRSIPDPRLLDIAEESVSELGYPLSVLAEGAPSLPVMRVDDDDDDRLGGAVQPAEEAWQEYAATEFEEHARDDGQPDLGAESAVEPEAAEAPEASASASADDAASGLSEPSEEDFDLGLVDEVEGLPTAGIDEPAEVDLAAPASASADDAPSGLSEPSEEDFDLGLGADDEGRPTAGIDEPEEAGLAAAASGSADDAPSGLSEPSEEDFDLGLVEEVEGLPTAGIDEPAEVDLAAPASASADDAPSGLSAPTEDAFDLGAVEWDAESASSEITAVEVPAAEDDDDDESLIDDEIIEIFLEEVDEVLEHLDERLPLLRSHPGDREALGDVRRAFHTLKGSGRMVGAAVIGEMAWSVENLLNRVIDGTIDASTPVLDLVQRARAAVPALRQAFAERRDEDIDVQRLMENADILASGGSEDELQDEDDEVASQPKDAPTPSEADFALDESFDAAFEAPGQAEVADEETESDLLEVFDQEAGEHLATLQAYLAERSRTGRCPPLEDAVRRALHTLKGSAAMADLPGLSELAARQEQLVRGYLEIQRAADDALLDILQRGVERMEALRSHLRETGDEPVFADADAQFVDAAEALNSELLAEIAARESGASAGGTVTEVFRSDGMARIVDAAPVLDAWAAGQGALEERVTLATELAGLGQRARAVGEGAIAALASALAAALQRQEAAGPDLQHAVREGHEQLLAQLDALAAGLLVPDAGAAVAGLEALADEPGGAADESGVDDPNTLDLDAEMLEIFFEEADELLQDMETGLAEWPSPPARDGLMRALHTLKGGARMAGLDGLGSRVHNLETWLGERSDDDPSVQGRLQDELDDLVDRVARLRRGEVVGGASSRVEPPAPSAPAEAVDAHADVDVGDDLSSTTSAPTETDFDLDGLGADDLLSSPVPEPTPAPAAPEPAPPAAAPIQAEPEPLPSAAPAAAEAGVEDADPEILALFLEEATELTESLDATVGRWQQEPDNELHLESLLRDLHTLKGGARMAGLSGLGDTAHDLETTLTTVRGQTPAADFVSGIQDAVDALISRVARLDPKQAEPAAASVPAPQPAPESAPSPALSPVEAPGVPAAAGSPTPEPASAARAEPERSAADAPLKEASQEMIRVAAGLLDDLVSLAGESSIMRGRITQQVADFGQALEEMAATIERIRQQVRRLEMETEAQVLFRQEQTAKEGYEDFDPLEMDRYSQLQELTRTLAESASDVTDLRQTLVDRARDTETLLLQQGRIHTELQEGLMRTRMVPFSRLLPRLQRIVRQVGRELSKPVNLEVRDAEGELDRNILERMIPPLEHMLRNAVDHGIESAERRAERGKPAAGTITLRLAREGGEILVEVSDDGGGIDASVIRRKAIEKGLLDADAQASEEELLGFIMAPGFSTAQAVTQISGRGVGMDVVNSEVRQMGGSISIASVLGEGTRFTVRLPFTVSINRALMVILGEDEYALPLNTIEGIVRVSPQQLKRQYEGDAPGFNYAGRNYALSYLGTWLGHPAPVREDVQSLPVLMVRSGEQGRAVHVDGVAGSREIVVKSLGPQFAGVQGVSGATILGDGRVVVILDLPSLLRGAAEFSLDQGSVTPARREERPTQVLVVDDSVTVRKVTTRLLERQGMAVTVAKDGVEAVSVLQDMRPDVMLLDIEMPRMDGFEVARHVRNEARLEGLPIIMITSRTGDKHRERAEALGVNRFLGKPFQEAELLSTIEELTGP